VQCLGTFGLYFPQTQPLEAMNWAEYISRIFYVLTFPELFQYSICRISLHTITQISCVHAVLRVLILFFNLTNQRKLDNNHLTVEPRAVDPHCFDADPDPAQNLDSDPDPDPGVGGRSAKNVHPPW
jgi:hypothetical protein